MFFGGFHMADVLMLFYGGEVAEGKDFSPMPEYCSITSVSIGLIVLVS